MLEDITLARIERRERVAPSKPQNQQQNRPFHMPSNRIFVTIARQSRLASSHACAAARLYWIIKNSQIQQQKRELRPHGDRKTDAFASDLLEFDDTPHVAQEATLSQKLEEV